MHFTDQLVKRLKEEFPERSFEIAAPPGLVVTIPPDHPEVGAIEIYDEDGELTVNIGRFTHCHFSPYNYSGFSDQELVVELVDDTISFIRDVFLDKIVFWGAHSSSGGTYRVGVTPGTPIKPWGPRYVWSGEYRDA
jgi:hypothetical protein